MNGLQIVSRTQVEERNADGVEVWMVLLTCGHMCFLTISSPKNVEPPVSTPICPECVLGDKGVMYCAE